MVGTASWGDSGLCLEAFKRCNKVFGFVFLLYTLHHRCSRGPLGGPHRALSLVMLGVNTTLPAERR